MMKSRRPHQSGRLDRTLESSAPAVRADRSGFLPAHVLRRGAFGASRARHAPDNDVRPTDCGRRELGDVVPAELVVGVEEENEVGFRKTQTAVARGGLARSAPGRPPATAPRTDLDDRAARIGRAVIDHDQVNQLG